jgi:hypothetical protein
MKRLNRQLPDKSDLWFMMLHYSYFIQNCKVWLGNDGNFLKSRHLWEVRVLLVRDQMRKLIGLRPCLVLLCCALVVMMYSVVLRHEMKVKLVKKQCLVTDCYAFEKLYITGLANSELDMSNIFLLGRPCIKICHLYFLSWEDLRM